MTTVLTQEPLAPPAPPPSGDEALYEIVNGKYVELPPMSTFAGVVASRLAIKMGTHNDANPIGQVVSEMLFGLRLSLRRRPDVAFVSYQRWARGRAVPHTDPWPVVPDLAVEVVSPTDQAEPLMKKLVEYFEAGVQLVWVVYPMLQLVYVYESLTRVRGLTAADELDGGAVLPGFKVALAVLFADAPTDAEPENGAAS